MAAGPAVLHPTRSTRPGTSTEASTAANGLSRRSEGSNPEARLGSGWCDRRGDGDCRSHWLPWDGLRGGNCYLSINDPDRLPSRPTDTLQCSGQFIRQLCVATGLLPHNFAAFLSAMQISFTSPRPFSTTLFIAVLVMMLTCGKSFA